MELKLSDIFLKNQENDNKRIESEDAFLDKCIEDYKKISDMVKAYGTSEEKITFSNNLEKFNEECSIFINYIKQCTQNGVASILYMMRQGNLIYYGKYNRGMKTDNHTIEMVSNDDLKKLYELLQIEFASSFVDGCKHNTIEGWSLNPTIGENVMIDINSNSSNDRDWFYEESHKEQKNEPTNKYGI